jgi:hypothetical protein
VREKAITATNFAAGLCPNKLRYNELSRKTSVTDVRVVITLKGTTYWKTGAVLLTL